MGNSSRISKTYHSTSGYKHREHRSRKGRLSGWKIGQKKITRKAKNRWKEIKQWHDQPLEIRMKIKNKAYVKKD